MKKGISLVLLLACLITMAFNSPSEAFFKKFRKNNKPTESSSNKQEEKEKVLLVEIFAAWCPGCKNVQDIVDKLVSNSSDIKLIKLDVSTPSKVKESEKIASELGILDFYKSNKSKTSTIGVIAPTSKEIIGVFYNDDDINAYKVAIQNAKDKESKVN